MISNKQQEEEKEYKKSSPSIDKALVNQSDDDTTTINSNNLINNNNNTIIKPTINNNNNNTTNTNTTNNSNDGGDDKNENKLIMENNFFKIINENEQFKKLKIYLNERVKKERDFVRNFQYFFGVKSKKEFNYFWHLIFLASSELGNESMFASFLPFIFWHIDKHLGLEILLIWAIVSYFGQYIKELFQLPRPDLDTKLESCYESEFGFPSTHASGSLTLSITFFGYILKNYYIENILIIYLFKILIILWIVMCCLSRLYLGVHSPVDIYGGLIYGTILYLIFNNIFYYIQNYLIMESFIIPFLIFFISFLFMYFYKTSLNSMKDWRSSYGDTARIFGAYTGAWLGNWFLIYFYKPSYLVSKLLNLDIELPILKFINLNEFIFIIWTSIIGVILVLVSKEITKHLLFQLYKLFYLNENDKKLTMKQLMHSRYDIEVPIIFISYTMIGFTSTFIVPVFVIGKL